MNERQAQMDTPRQSIKQSNFTYKDIAWRAGISPGWFGEVLRGNYPYRGGYRLPRNIRVALQELRFEVPEALWTF